jgi:hypothetical protein
MQMKLAIILRDGLPGWQALNVTGHLALAIGRRADPQIMGRHPLVDGSGVAHMGICRFPVVTLKAQKEDIRRLVHAAKNHNGLLVADCPREMLDTYEDSELVAAMAAKAEHEMEYLGVAVFGPTSELKRMTSGLPLWK